MKIKKKLTRKQFLAQEDEFIVFMKKALSWVKQNINLIVFGVIGIGIAVTAVWGIRYKQKADITNSAKIFFEARQNYHAGIEGESPEQNLQQSEKMFKNKEEKYKASIEAFDQAVELYPSSSIAEDALFLKAEALYYSGKYDEAASVYNQYLKKYGLNNPFSVQAFVSLGYIHEEKEEYQKAIDVFQKIINDYPDYLLSDTVLMELGRCYEDLKELDKAKETYQKVVMNFADSPMLQEAQQKLNSLGLNTATEPTTESNIETPIKTLTEGGKISEE